MDKVTVRYTVNNEQVEHVLAHIHDFRSYLDLLESIKRFGFLVIEEDNTAVAIPYHKILEIRYKGD